MNSKVEWWVLGKNTGPEIQAQWVAVVVVLNSVGVDDTSKNVVFRSQPAHLRVCLHSAHPRVSPHIALPTYGPALPQLSIFTAVL